MICPICKEEMRQSDTIFNFFKCNKENNHSVSYSANDQSFRLKNKKVTIATNSLAPQKACQVFVGGKYIDSYYDITFQNIDTLFKSLNKLLPFI